MNIKIIYKQLNNSIDIEHLKELEKFVDMDISNISKDTDNIKKMKAKMHNLSVEEIEKQQMSVLIDLKSKIQNKIAELGG